MIKQVNQTELSARIAAAQAGYRDRKAGLDMNAGTDPESGRPVPKQVDGGTATFFISNSFQILPTYLEVIALGYKPHPASLVEVGKGQYGESVFDLYMYKPDDVIDAALIKIAEDETVKYHTEIEEHNEAFIQQQVDAQLRVDLAREERERAQAEAVRRAQVEKDIRATFQSVETTETTAPTKSRK